ncbi:hypothetical protein UXU46_00325 (plasmid) [Campylobacter jejuni]
MSNRYYRYSDVTKIGLLKNLSPNMHFWDAKVEDNYEYQLAIFIRKANVVLSSNNYDIYYNYSIELSFNFSDAS